MTVSEFIPSLLEEQVITMLCNIFVYPVKHDVKLNLFLQMFLLFPGEM